MAVARLLKANALLHVGCSAQNMTAHFHSLAELNESYFGNLLVGTLIGNIFFGVLCLQTHYYYFSRRNKDSWSLQFLVRAFSQVDRARAYLESFQVAGIWCVRAIRLLQIAHRELS